MKIGNSLNIKKLFLYKILISFIILAAIIVLPLKTFAIGQTTDPIILKNAMRGKEYQQTMIVINTEKKDARISFSAEGKINSWAEFYAPDNLKAPLADISMKSGEVRNITVLFKIPPDTPNGTYEGFISVVRKSDLAASTEESSTSVAQKIDRKVTITVNDNEVISYEVSIIPKTYDLKTGETLSIRLIYDNRGNVSVTPQAQVKIKKDGQSVYNSIYIYPEDQPAVRPGAVYEIPAIEIPTNNFAKGKYQVEMSFAENGKIIFEKKFKFSVGVIDELAAASAGTGGVWSGLNIIKLNFTWFVLGLLAVIILAVLYVKISKNRKFQKTLVKIDNYKDFN